MDPMPLTRDVVEFCCDTCGVVAGRITLTTETASNGRIWHNIKTFFDCSGGYGLNASVNAPVFAELQPLLADPPAATPRRICKVNENYVPFYCAECDLVYCIDEWDDIRAVIDHTDPYGSFEGESARCPHGHCRMISS
ncbi:hypothetical protein DFR70_11963 [Nocardia tenerifensis]|uniref:Uncharacterized protein n=1 Tax=Nocardia tenerifensis TaxID=228006 RepID=A0A318JP89_9NOCA|nr:hypothetical protein [Nocardia tenerifensis]PXX56511.1 hypothetical protein DFR70_11963 [Nocardia tenerifensis]